MVASGSPGEFPAMLNRLAAASLPLVLAGCVYQGTPVPVTGDTRPLEGEWDGTYSSEETGRSGTISFSLKAGTDSAFGDVWMIPRQSNLSPNPGADPGDYRPPRALPRPLRISFLACEDGEVTGRLDPYEDPETGERIFTTFEGRVRGDTLSGRFVSLYSPSGMRAHGAWSVTRKPENPSTPPSPERRAPSH